MRRALASANAQDSIRSSVQVRKVMQRLVDLVQEPGDQAASTPAEAETAATPTSPAD
jgi:hypothetical protein